MVAWVAVCSDCIVFKQGPCITASCCRVPTNELQVHFLKPKMDTEHAFVPEAHKPDN